MSDTEPAASGALPPAPGCIWIEVCFADVGGAWQRELQVPESATVGDAISASGFLVAYPNVDPVTAGVGVYGKLATMTTALRPHDRIEIYRALRFDPKDSRRRRVEHRLRKQRQARGG